LDNHSKWRGDLAKELVEKARKEVEELDDKDKAKDDGQRGKDELFDSADKKGRIKCLGIKINGRNTGSRMDCVSVKLLIWSEG
jgi:hypothetical protein